MNAAPKNSSILYSRKIVPAQNKAKQFNSATFLVSVSFQQLLIPVGRACKEKSYAFVGERLNC